MAFNSELSSNVLDFFKSFWKNNGINLTQNDYIAIRESSSEGIATATIGRKPFQETCRLTRPNNTTNYNANRIINAATDSSSLPKWSFGAENANKQIQITCASILTNSTGKNMILYLFKNSDLSANGQSIVGDNWTFTPDYDEYDTKRAGKQIILDQNKDITGSTIRVRGTNDTNIIADLDANGDLYFAPVLAEAYATPTANQKYSFIIAGYIL